MNNKNFKVGVKIGDLIQWNMNPPYYIGIIVGKGKHCYEKKILWFDSPIVIIKGLRTIKLFEWNKENE